jgi:hypothetical protein
MESVPSSVHDPLADGGANWPTIDALPFATPVVGLFCNPKIVGCKSP